MTSNVNTGSGRQDNKKQFAQSSLLALMATTQVTGVIFIIQRLAPDFPILLTVLLIFIFSWEAIATTRWLASRNQLLINATVYRCAELITLLVTVRIVFWIVNGELPILGQVVEDVKDRTLIFFDREFFMALTPVVIAWLRACHYGRVFHELGVSDDEATLYAQYRDTPHNFPAGPPLDRNRSAIARDFQHSWAWGGVFLIACVVIATLDLSNLEIDEPISRVYLTLTVLLYFGSGFWLASDARHQALSAKWLLSGTGRRGEIVTRWRKSTGWLICGLAIIASFLPAGAILPIAEVLHFFFDALMIFINFALLIFTGLVYFLISLFNSEQTTEIVASDLPGDLLPNVPQSNAVFMPETISTSLDLGPLLWLLLGTFLALALLYFTYERSRSWSGDFRSLLTTIFRWLTHRQPSKASGNTAAFDSDTPFDGQTIKRRHRILRGRRFLLKLDPSGQVRELYRRLVAEAGKRHRKRLPAETPLEYQQILSTRWPEQSLLINDFTRSFIKARYSTSPITATEVGTVKRIYRALRSGFRKTRRS